jgi:hypothetical protein
MWTWLHLQTVGLWPLVVHYSFAVVGVLVCLAFSYLSPVNKSWGLWAAGIIVAGTVCYAVGVSNGESHIKAKWDAAEKAAVKKGAAARNAAERTVSKLPVGRVRNDAYDRDNR